MNLAKLRSWRDERRRQRQQHARRDRPWVELEPDPLEEELMITTQYTSPHLAAPQRKEPAR